MQRVAVLALVLLSVPAWAAEREDVRKVVNLVTSVKMPFPENLPRNRAKTERVWIERDGLTTGCIHIEERRWCYEHIKPEGNRAEMLRIRNEPRRGIAIGTLWYYMVDFDLDGLPDVGSTTKMEEPAHAPVAKVIQFMHRGTGRGDQFRQEYQKSTMTASRSRSNILASKRKGARAHARAFSTVALQLW